MKDETFKPRLPMHTLMEPLAEQSTSKLQSRSATSAPTSSPAGDAGRPRVVCSTGGHQSEEVLGFGSLFASLARTSPHCRVLSGCLI